jgi:hypothetical protein
MVKPENFVLGGVHVDRWSEPRCRANVGCSQAVVREPLAGRLKQRCEKSDGNKIYRMERKGKEVRKEKF